jgi:AraC family transcriptional regulator, regulatory protein of adaptative response / DNA-3-methyladenine glycosylase II
MPTAAHVADAGAARLASLGVPRQRAEAVAALARFVADGALRLEPGGHPGTARQALASIPGMGTRRATAILMRALYWPDAFPASDPRLLRAARVADPCELLECAERWRPWRSYAALHLWHMAAQRRSGPMQPLVRGRHIVSFATSDGCGSAFVG